jgi:uncharacterized membrane protein YdfJ with MMPL/SSD domain
MNLTTTIAQILVRAGGMIQIGLGALFWTYNALNLIPVHMLIGLVVVISLWVLAFVAARSGVHPALVGFAFAWGAFVPVFGMTQTEILPGSLHWIVQVLHLLVGLTAMGLAERLATRIRANRSHGQVAYAPVGARN